MEIVRKPFQGVRNVVRFNWHFYFLIALCLLLGVTVGFPISYAGEIVFLVLVLSATFVSFVFRFTCTIFRESITLNG